ncbi:MAG: TonB-dependent receptor [Gammaproteobacteria bacterium]|nr:TonB-dependent receptor [Gammaproteobacteria bacterium]
MGRKFVLTGLGYAILGLALGIYMAASRNHAHLVTYANIMLVGFAVSFVYGLCHKLWLNNISSRLVNIQYYTHQAGSAVLFLGLFLLYGKFIDAGNIKLILAVASATIFTGLVLMTVLFMRSGKEQVSSRAARADTPMVGLISRKQNCLSKNTPRRAHGGDH